MKTKKQWPKIKRVVNHGKAAWVVDCRIGGRGTRRLFQTRAEAEGEAEAARIRRANEGASAVVNSELAAYGWTVQKAIEFTLEHLRRAAKSEPLADAIAAFTATKAGKSEAYRRDLRLVLDALKTAHPTATTASVTTDDLDSFLSGLHPVTANNRRRVLSVFFSWCVARGLRADNPVKGVAVEKVSHGTPGIITPEELAAMLANAEDCILPAIVLAAFAGIRQAEISRLDWRNVDLKESVVTLDAGTTKTNSRRAVRLPIVAVKWLEPLAKKRGLVFVSGPATRAAWDLCRMAAGYGPFETRLLRVRRATEASKARRKSLRPWPSNALRHSALSYRLALRPEAAATAFNVAPEAAAAVSGIEAVAYASGNGPKVIRAHYDALGKPSAAAAWFSIEPARAANVVSMTA